MNPIVKIFSNNNLNINNLLLSMKNFRLFPKKHCKMVLGALLNKEKLNNDWTYGTEDIFFFVSFSFTE